MFTGIIEEMGTIHHIEKGNHSARLSIRCKKILEDIHTGDSIAVNGICLTVTQHTGIGFTADVMPETLHRSSLSAISMGSAVNLERAMAVNGRLGGHIVSGHVDGVGHITDIRKDDNAVWYTIGTPPGLLRYVVEKGSITIDGISLTVASVEEHSFCVSTIPHTGAVTTLHLRKKGDPVNLETDLIGRYVEKLLNSSAQATVNQDSAVQSTSVSTIASSGLTKEYLSSHGFLS